MRVLLLEDDQDQAETMIAWLGTAGHQISHFTHVRDCSTELRRDSFDLLILDWMLPDGSGLDLLRWFREQSAGRYAPVIFVTARESEQDTVAALGAGADDYLTKPVRRLELLSRMEAVWRRMRPATGEASMNFPPYCFDVESKQCYFNNREIELTDKEFAVAIFLFRNIGNLLSRRHILEAVWGISAELSTRTVDTHVSRIRLKLALRPENGFRLASVYNFGYRLEANKQPS